MLFGSGAAGARIATKEDPMKRSTILRLSIVGALCAIAGAAAGIAGSSASSTPAPHPRIGLGGRGFFFFKHGPLAGASGPLADVSGPPVHIEAVVPKRGGGFETVTMDRGSFSSLSASQLTINEGTKTATYKTVTVTIPSGATVRRNGVPAQLSDLKPGDDVTVVQSPRSTVVIANDAKHKLRFKPGLLRRHELPRNGSGLPPLPLPPAGAGATEAAPGAHVGPGA
jgi:hypothetical protein